MLFALLGLVNQLNIPGRIKDPTKLVGQTRLLLKQISIRVKVLIVLELFIIFEYNRIAILVTAVFRD